MLRPLPVLRSDGDIGGVDKRLVLSTLLTLQDEPSTNVLLFWGVCRVGTNGKIYSTSSVLMLALLRR